jgi:translation initiation factor IF-3
VRVLLGFEPEDLGVMPLSRAFDLAAELGLDLREEDLGTVRIYDHGKLVYKEEAAHRDARRLIRRAPRENEPNPPPHD